MNDTPSSSRKLSVILAADAEGYSRLMAADEDATVAALNEARETFRRHISGHGGRVVDVAGDGILAEFSSPVQAVRAAVGIQADLERWNAAKSAGRRMPFRIGINLGDVIEADATIYGDGVNIASRLQELAHPGGLCISGTVFDQVDGKLPVAFKSIGEQQVRNIPKPVRAYHLAGQGAGTGPRLPNRVVAGALAAMLALAVIWLMLRSGDKAPLQPASVAAPASAAIAVLPFDGPGEDPAQTHFADGFVEDILTRLSRFSEVSVISRNSSFRYRGKAVDVREIGRELGATYLLEGSMRRTRNTLRVSVQLLETSRGTHIWAEDFSMPAEGDDASRSQEAITSRIAATLADASGVIARAQFPAVASKPPGTLTTNECLLRARAYNDAYTEEMHLPVRECLETAAHREPTNAEVLAWLSIVYADEYTGPYNPRPQQYDAVSKALQTAEKSVLLEPASPLARLSLANAHFFGKNVEKFLTEGRTAAQLNPNNVTVVGLIGFNMVCAGHDEEGIRLLDRAVWLNPYHPNWYHFAYFHYQYRQKDYKRALETLHRINLPDWVFTQAFYAATYSRLGRRAELNRTVTRIRQLKPDYSIEDLRKQSRIWNMPDPFVESLAAELRAAGIPEKSAGVALPATNTLAGSPVLNGMSFLEVSADPSIAVLPFESKGDSPDEWLSDGFTETLITDLTRLDKLRVIARNSSFAYKNKDADVRAIGKALGVRYVLEGSIQQSADRLRVYVQLVEAGTGRHLWAERYDRLPADLFDVQDEITQRIVTELDVRLVQGEQARVWRGTTRNRKAYDLYLRGLAQARLHTREGWARAGDLHAEAIVLDPHFSRAIVALGWTHYHHGDGGWVADSRNAYREAIRHARQAIAIDPDLGDAYVLLANSLSTLKDFPGAVEAADKALAVAPNQADVLVLAGWVLAGNGRSLEAIDLINRALRLNPFPPDWYFGALGDAFLYSGRLGEAIPAHRRCAQRLSDFIYCQLGLTVSYASVGDLASAKLQSAAALRINPSITAEDNTFSRNAGIDSQRRRVVQALRLAGIP